MQPSWCCRWSGTTCHCYVNLSTPSSKVKGQGHLLLPSAVSSVDEIFEICTSPNSPTNCHRHYHHLSRRELVMFLPVCVCLSVCLSVKLLKQVWTNFDEIFVEVGAWPQEQLIRFCWRSRSGIFNGFFIYRCNSYKPTFVIGDINCSSHRKQHTLTINFLLLDRCLKTPISNNYSSSVIRLLLLNFDIFVHRS